MREGGPWIVAALMCDGLKRQEDGRGVIPDIGAGIMMPGPGEAPIDFYVLMTGGEPLSTPKLVIEMVTPSEESIAAQIETRAFPRHVGGTADATHTLFFPIKEAGLHWFHFWVNDRPLSALPAMVIFDAGKGFSRIL